ncbi:MAG: hypothetical protein R3362_04135 [Rhodothermales bacterium]|nr:hypothetical protein [Rhodothermales bacterium]
MSNPVIKTSCTGGKLKMTMENSGQPTNELEVSNAGKLHVYVSNKPIEFKVPAPLVRCGASGHTTYSLRPESQPHEIDLSDCLRRGEVYEGEITSPECEGVSDPKEGVSQAALIARPRMIVR